MKRPSFQLVLVSMVVLLGTSVFPSSSLTFYEPSSEQVLAGSVPVISNYGNYTPPASGDWIITENTQVVDLACTLNGSIVIENSTNINLTFVGGNVSFAVGDHGVRIRNATNVTVDGIQVVAGTRALVTIDDSNNITIQNALLRGSFVNETEAWTSGGINSHFSHNVTIVNMTIQNTAASVFIVNGSDWVFDTCVFELTPDSQIDDGELQFIQLCTRISIINSVLRNLTADGIEIYDSTDFLIENNTIIDIGAGIHIRPRDFPDPVSRINIINNTLINSGMQITGADNCLIDRNDVQNQTIWLHNSSNIIISNNWFDSPPTHRTMDFDTSTNITVIDNRFRMVVPDQVTGLLATSGNGTVSLSWDAPLHGSHPIANYTIYWSEIGHSFNEINPGNVTEYQHVGLDDGKEYCYVIAATNYAGTGESSVVVSATTWSVPDRVIDLQATLGDGHVNLTWAAPESDGGRPITGYTLYWTENFNIFYEINLGNVTEYQHAGLDNGKDYNYMVAAINDMGSGEGSMYVPVVLEGDDPSPGEGDPAGPSPPPPINAAPVLLVVACMLCGIVVVVSRLARRRE